MKGKDPRDAHFITSRICGICGDNHATCAITRRTWPLASATAAWREWIVNLGEAAEYMFDHNIFQDNLVGVDFCEQMVKETNPGVWAKAQTTARPHADMHGFRTIADIMTALNPFTGSSIAKRWPDEPHDARDVLPDGRAATCILRRSIPAASARCPRIQLFTDYLVRLMKYVEFMKKVVPLHDDLFDFFYEALPGYEEGRPAPHPAGLLGIVQRSGQLRLHLQEHGGVGPQDVCDARRGRGREAGHQQTWSTST